MHFQNTKAGIPFNGNTAGVFIELGADAREAVVANVKIILNSWLMERTSHLTPYVKEILKS